MKKSKRLVILVLVCAMIIPTVFAGGGKESEAPEKEPTVQEDYSETGTLNILWHAAGGTDGKFECTYLDYQSTVPDLLYDTLLKLDMENTSKYVPRMADSWEISDNELEYTFHIRDDLNWTDGVPVTAEDVVFSVEAKLRGYGIQNERGSFEYIQGAQDYVDGKADSVAGVIANGKNVTFKLTTPYGFFLRTMATFVPYPKHLFPSDVDYSNFGNYDYWEFPIHCGPYVLKDVTYPDFCVMERNEDWYGPKPGIKNVNGLSFGTGGIEAAAAAMIAGQLDLVHSNDYNDINFAQNIVAQNSDYAYNAFAAPYFRFFATNLVGSDDGKWNTFMGDANFRKAINYAIDKQGIASFFPGQAVALSTLVNPGDAYYNDDIPTFERDVEKAKEYLAESGYDGTPLRIAYYYSDQTTADLMDLVVQNLSEIGISADSQLFTQNLYAAIYESKNWDILYAGSNQMSNIENYKNLAPGAIYDMYLGNVEVREELFGSYMLEVQKTSDPDRLNELADILQENGLEYMAQIPVIAMDKMMIYHDAKWDFDPAWLSSSDLAIYRTCDLRLEEWKLLKP